MNRQTLFLPQGVLFDMDGTLIQTTQSAEQTWLDAFTHFGSFYHLAPQKLGEIMHEMYISYKKEIAGDHEKQLRDRLHPFEVRTEIVENVLAQAGEQNTSLAKEIVQVYEKFRDQHRSLIPFARETLEQLRQQHIRLALLTNGNATYQRRKIAQHQLAPFFECILIEEEFGVGKDDTRIYQAALERLQVRAEDAWMVGDNLLFDIAIPQQLGIVTLWFDPQKKGLPDHTSTHPDRLIHKLSEVLDEINSIRETFSN